MAASENTIEYRIYDLENKSLECLCLAIQDFCNSLMAEYIWQNGKFFVDNSFCTSGVPCLAGQTDVCENIDDEWFIVYILFEVSKKFPATVIQVCDSDGEFLLIEAANYLPKWLSPERSKNRVFIHRGQLHIIPLPSNPAEISVFPLTEPNIQQACALVAGPMKTEAGRLVQAQIMKRLNHYPEKVKKDFHHAYCFLPAEIALVLSGNPELVSPAVQAFYERDLLESKMCRTPRHFSPSSRIMALVKFTRHLYCQLMGTKCMPERGSGWALYSNRVSRKAADLGYKLTCGFEILCSKCHRDGEVHNKIPDKGWQKYLDRLTESGYFKGELEGSQLYLRLYAEAEKYYLEKCQMEIRARSDNRLPCDILQLIDEARKREDDIRKVSLSLPPEDSDDWMSLTSEDLDQMLLNSWGEGYPTERSCSKDTGNLDSLVSGMKSFVDNMSSFEGAEVPGQTPSEAVNDVEDDKIDFDPDVFLDTFKSIMKMPDARQFPNDSGSDLEVTDEDEEGVYSSCFDEAADLDPEIVQLTNQMDAELRGTSVGKTFCTPASSSQQGKGPLQAVAAPSELGAVGDASLADGEESLNIDLNLVRNFLESFASQEGLAGPVSSILQSMGMNLPPNGDGDPGIS